MWTPSDSKMPQSDRDNTTHPSAASLAAAPGVPARAASSATQNHSMIGKSIVIKGEITASDPLYINGAVEGLILAPAHRVTIGKEGKVKADISAREVVIMGEVHGNLDGGDSVEIRSEGSLTGDLAARRVCIEDGAQLNGAVHVRKGAEIEKPEVPQETHPAFEPAESTPAEEEDFDRLTSLAAS